MSAPRTSAEHQLAELSRDDATFRDDLDAWEGVLSYERVRPWDLDREESEDDDAT